MHKIIIPTGYMGSGSSAITDLVREFRGFEFSNGSFEYIFLHCPNGLFDLEDKLLIGNNALRSDEAIHSFYECMRELYYQKFWWFANYRKNFHPDFMKITEKYIEKLVQYEPSDYWYMQQKYTLPMILRLALRRILLIISRGRLGLELPLVYPQMKISLIESEEFYKISREYLMELFDCIGLKKGSLILDQLLLPFNLWRMEHYFGENTECFVVERDPRDVFIANKYVWGAEQDAPVPYPTDVSQYCEYYKRLRSMEKKVNNIHIHRLNFEDLIYNYEESVKKICKILSLNEGDHIAKNKYFNPFHSINNTQLFLNNKYQKETEIIEEKLSEFLYDFPYKHDVNMKKVF